MTVAHDAETRFPLLENTADTTTGNREFTHVPLGTPKGVVIVVVTDDETGDPVTGVLYGGVAMTFRQRATDITEVGRVVIYTLTDVTVPTGAQTVTLQGCTAFNKFATCSTVTAATSQTTVDVSGFKDTTTTTNPFIELTFTQEALMYAGMHWGGTSWPTTPLAGQTDQNHRDWGARAAITARRTSAEAAGAHQIGWTTSTEDHCLVAVAIAELAGGQTVAPTGFAVPATLGSPSATVTADAGPAGLPVGIGLGSPSAAFTASASPAGLAVPTVLGTPSAQVSATATPDGLAVPVTVGSPLAASVAQAAPAGLAVPVSVGSPTVTQDGAPQTVTPTGVAVPATLGSPTAEALATAQPTGLAVSVALGSPAASFIAAASPVGLAVPVAIGSPTAGQAGQTVTRPDTGTTSRPSTGLTLRPGAGSTARPSTGTTVRPDTGTTTRP